MPPTLILIRHAQAEHNATRDYTIRDPALTKLGFGEQCDTLAKHLQSELPLAQKIELIVVSPMMRTIQTAQNSLGWLMEKGIPVILKAEFQENSDKPCDTGSAISVMEKKWPQFDWSSVDSIYPENSGLFEFSMEGLRKRGVAARKFLRDRPEKVIAVVSHAGFLRTGLCQREFDNADYRIFDFKQDNDDLELVEWEMTEQKGGGLGKSKKGHFPLKEGDAPELSARGPGEVINERPVSKH
ncbi:uncharacterized protein L3040_009223 [Drepanopeziza brunnea f. sp. 'multigermtubi']|uniref:uncharacterized protein n=1 Tax=Drepanopeziza brunnea f. sp. 'multigermtubi' TaxID=698441 RepID=UPI00238395BE|nr:hypothetical protein L3040_009223 [Drepanopeziza brunnea f. sp. 'multigermtubi']